MEKEIAPPEQHSSGTSAAAGTGWKPADAAVYARGLWRVKVTVVDYESGPLREGAVRRVLVKSSDLPSVTAVLPTSLEPLPLYELEAGSSCSYLNSLGEQSNGKVLEQCVDWRGEPYYDLAVSSARGERIVRIAAESVTAPVAEAVPTKAEEEAVNGFAELLYEHADDLAANAALGKLGPGPWAQELLPDSKENLALRLRNRLHRWKSLPGVSHVVLGWIANGVDLLWSEVPPSDAFPRLARNGKGAREGESSVWLDLTVASLLERGVLRLVAEGEDFEACSPLNVVPKSGGRWRLIVDMRSVNEHLRKFDLAYETITKREGTIRNGDVAFSIDLQEGYWALMMAEKDLKYMGVRHGGERYFFCRLPFGLSSSCFVFSKLMGQVKREFRRRGWRTLFYLDDIAVWCRPEDAQRIASEALELLLDLGLSISWGKCGGIRPATCNDRAADATTLHRDGQPVARVVIEPTSDLTFLGFVVHTGGSGTDVLVSIKPERVEKMERQLAELLQANEEQLTVPVRLVASVAGGLMSASLCLSRAVRIRTRGLYQAIETRLDGNWNARIPLLETETQELQFWARQLPRLQPVPLFPTQPTASVVVEVDASDDAVGAFITECGRRPALSEWYASVAGGVSLEDLRDLRSGGVDVIFELFTEAEARQTNGRPTASTFRELLGARTALYRSRERLRNRCVVLYMDNLAATFILRKGSRKPYLNALATQVLDLCVEYNITLTVVWNPRTQQQLSDAISKLAGEYVLERPLFEELHSRYTFTIDLFASESAAQLPRYYGRVIDGGCEAAGVDAFAHSWTGECCWAFPPVGLVAHTLEYMRCQESRGVIVAPHAQHAPWWPLLKAAADAAPALDAGKLFRTEARRPGLTRLLGREDGARDPACAYGDTDSSGLIFAYVDFRRAVEPPLEDAALARALRGKSRAASRLQRRPR